MVSRGIDGRGGDRVDGDLSPEVQQKESQFSP
jgi:hypothetical protein